MEKLDLTQEWDKVFPKNSRPVGAIRQACCFFISSIFYSPVPQISIASIMGRMDSPKLDSAYSTLGRSFFGISCALTPGSP